MDPIDLNRPTGDGQPQQRDHGCVSGPVGVIFRDHQVRLLQLISVATAAGLVCCGAVAWLTEPQIIGALSRLPSSIVVQKEYFLRPDLMTVNGQDERYQRWKRRLRHQYEGIEASDRHQYAFCRQNMPSPLSEMGLLGDQRITGVRCFGFQNRRDEDQTRQPLMHNKFVVFSRFRLVPVPEPASRSEHDISEYVEVSWDPQMVWTGSANFSKRSKVSRENSLVIRDPVIARAYLHEWAQLMSLSEPLDWESEWIDPQWDGRT